MSSDENDDQCISETNSDLMTKSEYDKVIFHEIAESYPTDADVECHYSLTKSVIPCVGDKIALYKIGWESPHMYVKSEDAIIPEANSGITEFMILLKAESLPKDDGIFYQFCYICSDGVIRGASIPFRFRLPTTDELVEIEDTDSDLLIIRSRTAVIEEKLRELAFKNNELNKCNSNLVSELKEKNGHCNKLQSQLLALEIDLKSLKVELEQVNAKHDGAVNQLEETVALLSHDKAAFHSHMVQNDAYIEELRSTIKILSEKNDEAIAVFEAEKKLKDDLVNELHAAHVQLKNSKRLHIKMKEDFIKEEEKIRFNNELLVSLESNLRKEQMKNAEMKKKETFLDGEKLDLMNRLVDTEHMLCVMEKSKLLATEELRIHTEDKKKNAKELEEAKTLIHSLQEQITVAKSEEKQLCQELEQLINANAQLLEQRDSLQKECEAFARMQDQWSIENTAINATVDDLKNRLQIGAAEYETKYIECLKLEKRLGKLKKKIKGKNGSETSKESTEEVCSNTTDAQPQEPDSATSDENEIQMTSDLTSYLEKEFAAKDILIASLQQKIDGILKVASLPDNAFLKLEAKPSQPHSFPPITSPEMTATTNITSPEDMKVVPQYTCTCSAETVRLVAGGQGNHLPPPMQPEITALAKLAAITAVTRHFTERVSTESIAGHEYRNEMDSPAAYTDVESDSRQVIGSSQPPSNLNIEADFDSEASILQIEKCPVCEFPFDDPLMLREHVERHFGQECPICSEIFGPERQAELEEHVQAHFLNENSASYRRYDLSFD